jgi:cell division transport system ATP-binding protein
MGTRILRLRSTKTVPAGSRPERQQSGIFFSTAEAIGEALIQTPLMPPEPNPAIRVIRVTKQYGPITALRDISLSVYEGDFLFVTGPSGAGKSTLIKLLYMGEGFTSGSILVDGVNLARVTRKQIPAHRRKFGVVFQDFKLIPSRTVFENVALVLEVARRRPDEIRDRVYSVLETAGIADRANDYPPVLSGGEQQRVALARAMVGEPRYVLADEPTGSLDPKSAARVYRLLQAAHRRGATVIIATHDTSIIRAYTGPVVRLAEGRMQMNAANSG